MDGESSTCSFGNPSEVRRKATTEAISLGPSGPPRRLDHADIVVPPRPLPMALSRYRSDTTDRKRAFAMAGA